jgi:nucleoside-diphosphate-sugar epimerase
MKVLVSGHLGYIGTVMAPMIAKAGHEVVGLDIDLYERCTFGPRFTTFPGIKKDIRDVEVADLRGIDAVVHLAALSNDPLGNFNPELTYDINHLGTIHLAKTAKAAGVKRFIFSSSCSNYGASAGDKLLDESSEFNPVTPYGISKVRSEKDLSQLADDKFCPVLMRSATAYGVSPRLRFDIVLNNLTAWAVASGKILIKSDGTPWRPIVHIEDISRAFISALNAPRELVFNQAFNVGRSEENYRIKEIAEIVRVTVPNCEVAYAPDGGPDTRCYRVDCSKIARTLKEFKPQWDARKGAKQLYEAFVANGVKLEDFEGPRYKRIDHIKQLIADGLLDSSLRWTGKTTAPTTNQHR